VDKTDTPSAQCHVHSTRSISRSGTIERRIRLANFLREAGLVIAVCLGLAMLAQGLVMVVGQY